MLLNCGIGENSLRVPWTARRSNQPILKEINPEYSLEELMLKSWCSNILATWCEELTHWKSPWCWEKLKAGEGNDRGWDSWMASLTWVWASSRSWWWMGKHGMLLSMGLQRVRHEQQIWQGGSEIFFSFAKRFYFESYLKYKGQRRISKTQRT